MEQLVILGLILSSIIGAGTVGFVMMNNGDPGMMGGDHGMMGDTGMSDEFREQYDNGPEYNDGGMDDNCEDNSYDDLEAISGYCDEYIFEHCEHGEHTIINMIDP